MTKINHEEYEVLKGLDDKWKWIARDKDGVLGVSDEKVVKTKFYTFWIMAIKKKIDSSLFSFIQWEDEEPYNIAELIEEYEKDYKGSWGHAIEFSKELFGESEGTEVKKDIEWLKEELNYFIKSEVLDEREIGFELAIGEVIDLLNQIDEPEVVSQKLPVIPDYVEERIEKSKENKLELGEVFSGVFTSLNLVTNPTEDLFWIRDNQELFARAWLDGFTVEEEEEKYYVDLESAAYVAKWEGNDQVGIYTDGISGSDEFEFHLTEQEIKDFDERFWPFRKPAEEAEEDD